MKKSFRTEKVEKYIFEGWKFRVKQVGSHRYIIRYKGKEERSLGPYNDGLWRFIEEKGGEKAKPRRDRALSVIEIKRLKDRVSRLEGFEESAKRKSKSCPQIASWFGFTYCKAQSWDRKPTKLMQIYPQFEFKRIMPDRVNKKWYVSPHTDLCRCCVMPLLIPFNLVDNLNKVSKLIDELESDVGDIEVSLEQLEDSARRRTRDDHNGCKHIQSDGICSYWHYYKRIWYLEQKEDTIFENNKSIIVYRNNVRKSPLICAACPSYESRGNPKSSNT